MYFNFNFDLMVVEISTPGNPFIFRFNKDPGEFGKCEGCYYIKPLPVKCECEKVLYCTMTCKIKDESFHKPKCEVENKIDFDKL